MGFKTARDNAKLSAKEWDDWQTFLHYMWYNIEKERYYVDPADYRGTDTILCPEPKP